jgi:hypothetical protein
MVVKRSAIAIYTKLNNISSISAMFGLEMGGYSLMLSNKTKQNRISYKAIKNFQILKMLSSIFFASVALAQVPTYGDCNKENFKLKSLVGKSFPLVPSLAGGPIIIKGDVIFY